MKTRRMLAVDLGASGGKCFAGTLDRKNGFRMEEIHRFPHEAVEIHVPEADGRITARLYWDDTLLYQQTVAGLAAFRRVFGARLDSIGIDTWGADGQFMTPHGELVGKVYCYRDHRLDGMMEQVKQRIDAARIYEVTGIHFQPFNVSNQILWFMQNRRRLLRPGCFYVPVPTLFYFYLGGVRCVDSSWASVTQLMDARQRCWSRIILRRLGIPPGVMPPIVDPGTVVGAMHPGLADSVGLRPPPRLIAVASHDTASAFAAAPARNPEEALIISSGTWSLIGKLLPRPITTEAARRLNFSNEGGIGNIRFLKNCAGTWLVQELRRVWRAADGREMEWGEITDLARRASPFRTLIDPDDPGFYNPRNMESAIVSYCRRVRQPVPADRGAFLRAVYESLALKYRLVSDQILQVCGGRTRVAHIVGGGSRNALLNQFASNALGIPVLAGPEEATAVGNFMVQAMGLGMIRSMDQAQPLIHQAFSIQTYRPEDQDAWNAAYARFRRLCGES